MTSGKPWRVATRRSRLAQAQAGQVAEAMHAVTGRPAELVPLATTGDDNPDRAIEAFDAKGLFVDATREAVRTGDCDFVVHSFKDLPTEPAPGLVIACVPARVDPRDVLVTRDGWRLSELPRDRVLHVGTSSARRRAQLLRSRRDLQVQPLRGNLDTRLAKVVDGELDAIVVAMAGLLRLEVDVPLKAIPLEHGECLHAPAQGALAIECRVDDIATRAALGALDDAGTRAVVAAERALLVGLQGGCTAPIGAHAEFRQVDGHTRLELLGMLADPNGTRLVRASHQGGVDAPDQLGLALASTLATEGSAIMQRLGRG